MEINTTEAYVFNDSKKSLISKFISTFKRFCNKEIGYNIWQNRSYDHVIRDKRDYDEHINTYMKIQLNGVLINYIPNNCLNCHQV